MTWIRDALGSYGDELVAWAHSENWKAKRERREPMKGPERYCVMCLADGEKAAATHIIDAAGYCRACTKVQLNAGNGPARTLEDWKAKQGSNHAKRLTAEQKKEIAAADRLIPATVLARKYGVTGQTILNVRKEFPDEGPLASEMLRPSPRDICRAVADAVSAMPLQEMVNISMPQPESEPDTPIEEPEQDVEQQAEPEPAKCTMTLELAITHEQADCVWNNLELEDKARIVSALVAERWMGLR